MLICAFGGKEALNPYGGAKAEAADLPGKFMNVRRGDIIVSGATHGVVWSVDTMTADVFRLNASGSVALREGVKSVPVASATVCGRVSDEVIERMKRFEKTRAYGESTRADVATRSAWANWTHTIAPQGRPFSNGEGKFSDGCYWVQKKSS